MNINSKHISSRLVSLDVLRGITVALMIIVNSPGNNHPYSWLEHSTWNGCTLADLVFPFFIVIVGISSVLALSNARKSSSFSCLIQKIIKRSVYIFIIGVLLNAFSMHFQLSTLRIPGVLQRIAICYFFSALLFLRTRIQTQAIIMVSLVMGYGLISYISPLGLEVNSLTEEGSLAGYLDRLIFTPSHLYTSTFDPEGFLSTFSALASVLLGNLIGFYLTLPRTKKQHVQGLLIAGVCLAFLGWVGSFILPWNKALWSSSYVLWSGGLLLIVYASIYALIEIKQWKGWSAPFDLLGRHAMLVYVLHVLFLKIQAMIHVHNAKGVIVNARLYITDILFNYFSPENASLCYSVTYTLFWLFVAGCFKKWQQWVK